MRRAARRRWLQAPLLHFLAGGCLLFLLVHGGPLRAPRTPGVEPIVVSSADVAALAAAYTRDTGLPATPPAEAALIDDAIDEELLVREARRRGLDRDRSIRIWLIEQMRVLESGPAADEALYARALALGLDRSDLVVRRILVHKMRLLAARAGEEPPGDAALRAFFEAHAGDYRVPARFSFWHLFVASSRGASDRDGARSLAALRGEAPADAVRRADPFIAPPHVREWPAAQVAKSFGPGFVAGLERAPQRQWIGPVTSPYGAHFVWIESRTAGEVAPFETVRSRVRERWLDEARAGRVARLLQTLRRETPLVIASSSWRESRGS